MCDEIDKTKVAAQKQIEHGPAGRFRHYKGGLYDVIMLAVDENTLAPVVVYQSVERGYVWTRPLEEWNGVVEHEGRKVPRFVSCEPVAAREVPAALGAKRRPRDGGADHECG